ncbi:MAG: hypothetical protein CL572_00920 [Alphaproteobacteria bacterium]|jgi:uncharacterized surface protein with fasciclin (FAS1) repeats|nr:hypothetical protein [Alphaproteobacteria bacterium]
MIKIFKTIKKPLFLFLFIISISLNVGSKNIVEIIKEDSELSVFYSHLKKTGLDEILQKNLPWKWTIFAPTNKAFEATPERVKKEILSNDLYNKNIIMDHMLTGQKTSLNVGEEISVEVTVSDKALPIYKRGSLFVKDMIVIKENSESENGTVHKINCIMYVQPSVDDSRLTDIEKKDFPITSCCMRSNEEINEWIKATKLKL